MSSNLPPGVTQSMIDATFQGPCPECADGWHEGCDDDECVCQVCDDAAEEDAAEAAMEARKEREMFPDDRDDHSYYDDPEG